jgi:hypothetical protein
MLIQVLIRSGSGRSTDTELATMLLICRYACMPSSHLTIIHGLVVVIFLPLQMSYPSHRGLGVCTGSGTQQRNMCARQTRSTEIFGQPRSKKNYSGNQVCRRLHCASQCMAVCLTELHEARVCVRTKIRTPRFPRAVLELPLSLLY